jgi:hypothetical protein
MPAASSEVERVGAGEIHTDEPVGAAASARRIGQRIEVAPVAELREALADRLGSQRRDPEAQDRLAAARGLIDVAKDQLALAAGVRGTDHPLHLGRVEDLFDRLELLMGVLGHDERPVLRKHGELAAVPALPVGPDLPRLGQSNEMADRPGHRVAIAIEAPWPALLRSQDLREVPGDGRLFGKNGDSAH